MSIQPEPPEPLKLFISYSRHDVRFVDRLVEALEKCGFEVQIDRRDLPLLEDWQRELLHFIQQCDTVVFIVSPDSLASKIVHWEVEQVALYGKRLAPVVIGDVDVARIPSEISRINFIFFTGDAVFEQRVEELAHALNTDFAWLKEHTRLGELARHWIDRGRPDDALLRGQEIDDAAAWVARRSHNAPPVTAAQQEFLGAARTAQIREIRRRRLVAGVLVVVLVGGLGYAAWLNQSSLRVRLISLNEMLWPKTLSASAERALKPRDAFKECSGCPEMVVIPGDAFAMGSPESEPGRKATEGPQHRVLIPYAFAISRFEVTFEEWEACVALAGCEYQPPDEGWGRGTRPVINVSWDDARQYAAWLARRTGKPYRLLSEAEWEYAARAGAAGAYAWGDDIGDTKANCRSCGSRWDNNQTAPVGSFAANGFGIHDMHGNIWEWVEDCWHDSYRGAPADGSAWTAGCTDNARHVVRGGGWNDEPADLRAATRYDGPTRIRNWVNGIRIARMLNQ